MLGAPPEATREPEGPKLNGRTVVLVEDDDDSRQLLCELLSEMGATCLSAGSGNQALALFAQASPDVLVSDLWMADGDGFELIRAIRALPPEKGGLTPAIAVSAASNAEEALMAGYHVLIAKPYDPFKLATAIEEFSRTDDPERDRRDSGGRRQ